MQKQTFFEIKSARRWHGLVGVRATVDSNLRRPNSRPRVEARESKDGGGLLGFYILEANKENWGVGFMNHLSTEKL